MPSIQEELAALRSRKLTSKEATKLKDAAPMSTPEAVEATLQDHKVHLKHVDAIAPSTAAPTGTATVDMESNFYLQQTAKKQQDKKKKQEAAEILRSYVAPPATTGRTPTASTPASTTEEASPKSTDETLKSDVAATPSLPTVAPETPPPEPAPAAAVASVATTDDEIPDLDEIPEPLQEVNPSSRYVDDAKPTQNRNEKKSRKIMQKLGLRPVYGILRATFKSSSKGGIFVIDKPDVFTANATTYVIFGEAKNQGSQAATATAAKNFQKPLQEAASIPNSDTPIPELFQTPNGDDDDGAVVDETGVDEGDVQLVMKQSGCSRAKAVKALKETDGDMIEAIMALTC